MSNPTIASVVAERDFQTQVSQLLALTGWKPYHTYNSLRSPKGFPDKLPGVKADEITLEWTFHGKSTTTVEWRVSNSVIGMVVRGVVMSMTIA